MAIYNFGMRGKEHLEHLLNDNPISFEKAEAFKKIINWATDYGLDVVEVYKELRVLLDVDRDGTSTITPLPNVYLLHADTYEKDTAIVIAFDEVEARVIASDMSESFLENSTCEIVDTSKVGLVHYNYTN